MTGDNPRPLAVWRQSISQTSNMMDDAADSPIIELPPVDHKGRGRGIVTREKSARLLQMNLANRCGGSISTVLVRGGVGHLRPRHRESALPVTAGMRAPPRQLPGLRWRPGRSNSLDKLLLIGALRSTGPGHAQANAPNCLWTSLYRQTGPSPQCSIIMSRSPRPSKEFERFK